RGNAELLPVARPQRSADQLRQLSRHADPDAMGAAVGLSDDRATPVYVSFDLRGRSLADAPAAGQPPADDQPDRSARLLRLQLLRTGGGGLVGASALLGKLHQFPGELPCAPADRSTR